MGAARKAAPVRRRDHAALAAVPAAGLGSEAGVLVPKVHCATSNDARHRRCCFGVGEDGSTTLDGESTGGIAAAGEAGGICKIGYGPKEVYPRSVSCG